MIIEYGEYIYWVFWVCLVYIEYVEFISSMYWVYIEYVEYILSIYWVCWVYIEYDLSGTELTEADDPHMRSVYTSGLISHAVLQYLYATNDTSLLQDQQYGEILTGIANYYYKLLQDSQEGANSFGISGT